MSGSSKQANKTIKISDIKDADFRDKTEPKDERLMELLKQAYAKKIYCRVAIIPFESIVPFSNFRPTITDDYVRYFNAKYATNRPPSILVYQREDGKFVMSDDYKAYFLYKQLNLYNIVCQILDAEAIPQGVIEVSDKYYMEFPDVEQINRT